MKSGTDRDKRAVDGYGADGFMQGVDSRSGEGSVSGRSRWWLRYKALIALGVMFVSAGLFELGVGGAVVLIPLSAVVALVFAIRDGVKVRRFSSVLIIMVTVVISTVALIPFFALGCWVIGSLLKKMPDTDTPLRPGDIAVDGLYCVFEGFDAEELREMAVCREREGVTLDRLFVHLCLPDSYREGDPVKGELRFCHPGNEEPFSSSDTIFVFAGADTFKLYDFRWRLERQVKELYVVFSTRDGDHLLYGEPPVFARTEGEEGEITVGGCF